MGAGKIALVLGTIAQAKKKKNTLERFTLSCHCFIVTLKLGVEEMEAVSTTLRPAFSFATKQQTDN